MIAYEWLYGMLQTKILRAGYLNTAYERNGIMIFPAFTGCLSAVCE